MLTLEQETPKAVLENLGKPFQFEDLTENEKFVFRIVGDLEKLTLHFVSAS